MVRKLVIARHDKCALRIELAVDDIVVARGTRDGDIDTRRRVASDLEYVGALSIAQHSVVWHDPTLQLTDSDVCAERFASYDRAGRDRDIGVNQARLRIEYAVHSQDLAV